MAKWIVKEENNLSGYDGLATAVIRKALYDYCSLCRGSEPNEYKNFDELKEFFNIDCETYLIGTELTGNDIFERVQKVAKGERL